MNQPFRDADRTSSDRAMAGAAYATAVLFATNLVGYLDRSILTLLVQAVKKSLHLSDGEVGLMLGAAFVVTFSLAGLFIGRLVDRLNRRNLLIVAVAIWTVSAAACGLARTGTELFIARMGVGVGEAAIFPVAVSLIADMFAPARRGTPYGLFTMGVYAGQGLSLILAGLALPWATHVSETLAADGRIVEPWRIILFLMLVPGVLCCGLLATMREPGRKQAATTHAVHHSGWADWAAGARVFLPHHLFMSFVTFGLVSVSAWMPTVLIREQHLATKSAGLLFGSTIAVTGILSAAIAGVVADRFSRRSGAAGPLRMALGCVAVGVAGFALLAVATTPTTLMAGAVLAFSPLSMALIAGIVAMSDLSPPRSRGQITSIYFLFTGIIGTAGGPALVGYLNDALGPHGHALSQVLSVTGAAAMAVALIFAVITMARVRSGAALPSAASRKGSS